MIQLKRDVVDPQEGVRAILALDLRKAFDRVKHSSILQEINRAGFGECTFQYILSFLKERTVFFEIEGRTSSLYNIDDRSTPQGSVSPHFSLI